MNDNIAPLVPADCDLRSFEFMPLQVQQLRDSDIVAIATGEEFRAAVLLWCAAWHQVPASSLPNDDRLLAHLIGMGRDLKGWGKIRDMALHGFILCSDGRLYHPVIADLAMTAFDKKRRNDDRTRNATEARKRSDGNVTVKKPQRNVQRRANVTFTKGEGEGQGEGQGEGETPLPPSQDDISEAVERWNDVASLRHLPRIQRMDERRKRHLRARLTDCGGIDGWKAAMAKVAESSFLCGHNDKNWRADFDFVLQQSSFTKLMEGKYDDHKPIGSGTAKDDSLRWLAEQAERREHGASQPDDCGEDGKHPERATAAAE